jgi:hypothetical protein
LFKKHGVVHLDTKSVHKASVVERFNRTLKEKLWRCFTETGSAKYIKILPEMVSSYNLSHHRSINMAPIKVTEKNVHLVKERLFGPDTYNIDNDYVVHFEFKVGSYVRQAIKKKIFAKGYQQNWSKEIFIVYFLNPTQPPTYKIKSLDNHENDWNFYKEELQHVPEQEFPYDSFQVLDETADEFLVSQLNSEKSTPIWIKRVQPPRAVKR